MAMRRDRTRRLRQQPPRPSTPADWSALMPIRTPSPSVFRRPIDQSALKENKALVAEIDRRKILRGTLSLGALTLLTGCDVTDRDAVQAVLKRVSSWNDLAQQFLFRP